MTARRRVVSRLLRLDLLGRQRADLDMQVSRIKERVEEKEGIPPAQQRLIFGGKQMYVSRPRRTQALFAFASANEAQQERRQDGRRIQPRGRRHPALGTCPPRRLLISPSRTTTGVRWSLG